jgi:hypothetical protein
MPGMSPFCTYRDSPWVCAGLARYVRGEWRHTAKPLASVNVYWFARGVFFFMNIKTVEPIKQVRPPQPFLDQLAIDFRFQLDLVFC